MNFREQQEEIINFITTNYPTYLPPIIPAPEITTEFLDFDRFKNDFTLFIDFSRIDFQQSRYDDDCGDIEHLSLVVYLVHRNNKSEILQDKNLESSWAFYTMIKENIGLDVAQDSTIESIDFYNYVEGSKYLVITEMNLSLSIEIYTIL
jgi:hypothetical protein